MKRIRFYKQHDSMQCGIACLQMICDYYGKRYSLEELSGICFASHEGVSLLGINQAAIMLGMHTECGRLEIEQLSEIVLPCILHWNQNHFVVLYCIKRRRKHYTYYVADPGKGLVKYDEKELVDGWISTCSHGGDNGVILLLQPTPAFYEHETNCNGEKRSFRFLLGYIRQYKKCFGQVILGLAVGSFLQLIFPCLTQAIVDVGIKHEDIG